MFKPIVAAGLAALLILALTPAAVAQKTPKVKPQPNPPQLGPLGPKLRSPDIAARPDLVVERIVFLQSSCRISVRIANRGRGAVPATGYHPTNGVAVQMWRDGKPWGGMSLRSFDPLKRAQPPGGFAQKLWFPRVVNLEFGQGEHELRVKVDSRNTVIESDERNNTKTVRHCCSRCGGPALIGLDP